MSSESSPKVPAYYIGAKAIAHRLGYKSPRMVDTLVRREGLLVHKRILKSRTGAYRALAISEAMIALWEASKGLQHVKSRRANAAPNARGWENRRAG